MVERNEVSVKENLRMMTILMRVSGKESDTGFLSRKDQILPLSPVGDGNKVAIKFHIKLSQVHVGF